MVDDDPPTVTCGPASARATEAHGTWGCCCSQRALGGAGTPARDARGAARSQQGCAATIAFSFLDCEAPSACGGRGLGRGIP